MGTAPRFRSRTSARSPSGVEVSGERIMDIETQDLTSRAAQRTQDFGRLDMGTAKNRSGLKFWLDRLGCKSVNLEAGRGAAA